MLNLPDLTQLSHEQKDELHMRACAYSTVSCRSAFDCAIWLAGTGQHGAPQS